MENLGALEGCAVLMLVGIVIILGFFLKWKWIYSKNNSKARNIAILLAGILFVICSVIFYFM